MPSRKRQGNDPRRRIASWGTISEAIRSNLSHALYTGSAHHKSRAADYNFVPPVNPRPDKSLCDDQRIITWREACRLFCSGVRLEMISSHLVNGFPKFVWAVDSQGEAYEAVLSGGGPTYHGYRLNRDQKMRGHVIGVWNQRKQ